MQKGKNERKKCTIFGNKKGKIRRKFTDSEETA